MLKNQKLKICFWIVLITANVNTISKTIRKQQSSNRILMTRQRVQYILWTELSKQLISILPVKVLSKDCWLTKMLSFQSLRKYLVITKHQCMKWMEWKHLDNKDRTDTNSRVSNVHKLQEPNPERVWIIQEKVLDKKESILVEILFEW